MRNPEATKEKILRQSGQLFNTQGYKATSLSDITKATGYTKGAIYRHFNSKDELEIETLSHLSGLMFDQLREKIKEAADAPGKINSILTFFETYISKPPVKGGCPLLNVAIEVDDAHPALRKRAVALLDVLRDSIKSILANGIRYGQINKDIDLEFYSTMIIGGLEGAIMMSKLRGSDEDIIRMTSHLKMQLNKITVSNHGQ